MRTSRRIVLVKRPVGVAKPEDFRLESEELRALKANEVRVEMRYLSVDPYMRGLLNAGGGYLELGIKSVPIGGVVLGEGVGTVAESTSDAVPVGTLVSVYSGWRDHLVTSARAVTALNADVSPASLHLGACGMPGRTAYCGLKKLGTVQPGDTVVVSGAAGAVGSVVGQLAKLWGASKVVGIAGGEEKCRHVTRDLGFDACIDYKAADFAAQLAAAVPDGINVYWENVGGDIARAVAALLAPGARVPVCGYIANYNATNRDFQTPMEIFQGAPNVPVTCEFFLVNQFQELHDEANDALQTLVREGKLNYHETTVVGIDKMVDAFIGLFKGNNTGKMIVKVDSEESRL